MSLAAEWIYSQGIITRDSAKLETAAKLFPIDIRFRRGPSEFWLNNENSSEAVAALKRAQRTDPYAPAFIEALMIHELRLGDKEAASEQFALLYRLAPQAPAVKALLTGRHRDP